MAARKKRKSAAAKRRSAAAAKGWETRRANARKAAALAKADKRIAARRANPNTTTFMVTHIYDASSQHARITEIFITVRWGWKRPQLSDALHIVQELARGRKPRGVAVNVIRYGHPRKSYRRTNAKDVDELAGVIVNATDSYAEVEREIIVGELSEE